MTYLIFGIISAAALLFGPRLASRVAAHQQLLLVADCEATFVKWVQVLSVCLREWRQ